MIPTGRKKWLVVIVVVFVFVFPVPNTQAVLDIGASLSVAERYTDNLFFTFANKKEDYGTFVTPSITATFSNKHITIGGTYSISGQYYLNNTQANSVSHGMNTIIDLPFLNRKFKNLEVRVSESFNIAPQLPAFSANSRQFTGASGGVTGGLGTGGGTGTSGGAGTGGIGGIGGVSGNSLGNQGIINQRSGSISFQNRASVLVIYNWNPRWDTSVQYSNSYRGGRSSQDSMSHGIQPRIGYKISEITKVRAGYNLRLTQFTGGSSNATGTATRGNATSHSLNIGVNHLLKPTIPTNMSLGVTVSETEADTTRLNFSGSSNISKIFPDGQISLRLSQRIGSGGGLTNSTTLSQNVVISASKTLTRFISGFLQVGLSRNSSLAGQTIRTNTVQFSGGASYRILEWLSGGVTYSYINQDSTGTTGNTAQSNSVFVGLTANTPTIKFFK